jgi:hypothetical protein
MIKIYKLIHNGQIVYVGKTKLKYLSNRKASGYGNTIPFFKECTIELIEETDDITKENYWIERLKDEGHPILNRRSGDTGLDNKEWRENNKEYIKEYMKEWYQNNKDKNKDKNKEYQKEWYQNNKEKKRQYLKEWRQKNKEKSKEYREKKKLKKIIY